MPSTPLHQEAIELRSLDRVCRNGAEAASRLALAVAFVGLLAGCSPKAEELLVFAAASLAEALSEIEEAYEATGEVNIAISYGGSQMLAQQIYSGAPADVFLSAGRSPVTFLREAGKVGLVTTDILANNLVVAVRSDVGLRLGSVAELATGPLERVAIANPELAPAGRYAREALISLGLWDRLQPVLVYGGDVRATLAYVESGNADAAVVYLTDALAGRGIDALDIVPHDSYSPIRYPAALIRRSGRAPGAEAFIGFLRSDEARDIFRRHGFEPVE